MRIVMHTDDGCEIDITEPVQIVYDAMHGGMEFGSGLLDTAEVDALRTMSDAAGWAPVEYELDQCADCGHVRRDHWKIHDPDRDWSCSHGASGPTTPAWTSVDAGSSSPSRATRRRAVVAHHAQ